MTAVADALEAQARFFRKVAAGVAASGEPFSVSVGNFLCSISVLTYEDLIDEALAFEADAIKLRKLHKKDRR